MTDIVGKLWGFCRAIQKGWGGVGCGDAAIRCAKGKKMCEERGSKVHDLASSI